MKTGSWVFGLPLAAAVLATSAQAGLGDHPTPGAAPGAQTGARYATDAYPGFDSEEGILAPSRKKPRWFQFLTGPSRGTAAEQAAYCDALAREGSWAKAARQLDALVRAWPTAPEAARAQRALADILRDRLGRVIDAFAEYRYLLDYYTDRCDYARTAEELYRTANLMRARGREILFVRFANTVDVRRAYEACVLRAPGAAWAPEAMLAIGALREDEGKYGEAVKVYENLRSLHPGSEEARVSIRREAGARMVLLRDHAYNRGRCRDTAAFLKAALAVCRPEDRGVLREALAEAQGRLEEEAWRGARFYDSPTRTRRSAVNAYERFLSDYPEGAHAGEAKARLAELEGGGT